MARHPFVLIFFRRLEMIRRFRKINEGYVTPTLEDDEMLKDIVHFLEDEGYKKVNLMKGYVWLFVEEMYGSRIFRLILENRGLKIQELRANRNDSFQESELIFTRDDFNDWWGANVI